MTGLEFFAMRDTHYRARMTLLGQQNGHFKDEGPLINRAYRVDLHGKIHVPDNGTHKWCNHFCPHHDVTRRRNRRHCGTGTLDALLPNDCHHGRGVTDGSGGDI